MIIDFACTTAAGCRNTMSPFGCYDLAERSPRTPKPEQILENVVGQCQQKARPARTGFPPKTNDTIIVLVFGGGGGGIIFHDELIFLISLVAVVVFEKRRAAIIEMKTKKEENVIVFAAE